MKSQHLQSNATFIKQETAAFSPGSDLFTYGTDKGECCFEENGPLL